MARSVSLSLCVCASVCRKLKRSFDVPRDEFRDADGETGTGGDDERRDGVAVHHDSGAGRGVKEPTSSVTLQRLRVGGEYRFKTRKRVSFAEHHHPVFV